MMTAAGAPSGAAILERRQSKEEAPHRWYAVQTLRGREGFAKENLERQNVRTYLPLFAQARVRRAAVVQQLSAFFPGYLFIRMPVVSPLWRSVRGTFGVARVVGSADAPTPAPPGFIEHLIERTSPEGVLGFADPLAPGDPVRVIGGAFDRVYGMLCSIEAGNRVIVLLNLMGRQVPVQISRQSLMACAK